MISIRNAKYAKKGLQDMIDYIREQGCKPTEMILVEIGCYVGDSTEIFAKNFGMVIAIDPWENGYDKTDPASYQHPMKVIEAQFDRLCKENFNIVKWKMKSEGAAKHFSDKDYIDIVYIDGVHQYENVKKDIEIWLPKIKKGGWLAGHDYQRRFPGTIKAVNEFRKPDKTFNDTSWIIRIK